ncbi:type II 3-dehydroquinate dehydratase [Corynebacterium sp. CCUG 71335]|uniref:type II 3-dehydroquinate dehydratase n=1 Tax=unclassified Corynebacterium TaxID=2624378 RepID=UPI00210C7D6F|nr:MULTISPECIES: type II 3-dehydroquinate dehydratase [unclassified Corynebacterium]MCQ4620402.1 type II 3-dehydroquinate dehydratase [Corynebacterium sp. CCUG 71335]MCQ4622238.1 type II 3-dehydroquinate dehydratase [Corynebacterium sp. CCUG 70398]MCQ4627065.1 type II 3-dehydroquinate dehydratase [Corynebacterium sp. CCUG 65737]
MKVLVLNGPNLNRLGKRQPEIYGSVTLADIEERLKTRAGDRAEIYFRQSNHEGVLIDAIHNAADNDWPVIINPGGYTHTSVALRDALVELQNGPGFVEVHISNVHAREPFRQHSFLSPIATGVIAGLGADGYELALEYFLRRA